MVDASDLDTNNDGIPDSVKDANRKAWYSEDDIDGVPNLLDLKSDDPDFDMWAVGYASRDLYGVGSCHPGRPRRRRHHGRDRHRAARIAGGASPAGDLRTLAVPWLRIAS